MVEAKILSKTLAPEEEEKERDKRREVAVLDRRRGKVEEYLARVIIKIHLGSPRETKMPRISLVTGFKIKREGLEVGRKRRIGKMAKSKDDIRYGTAQAKVNEEEALRVGYKTGTPLEGGKIAETETVDLFSSARNIPSVAHHHVPPGEDSSASTTTTTTTHTG